MTRRTRSAEGFTLLEVMVAIAILSVALVAIFSSQAGAISAANRANRRTVATLLARCKMAEIEETILRDGLPAIEASGEDECCEDAEFEGFRCRWSVDRVVLPDEMGEGEEGAGALDALGLGGGGEDGEGGPTPDSMLAGGMGGGDALSDMAMSFAFPILKTAIEEQVRRADVTVVWREGEAEKELRVTQFLVHEPSATEDGT